MRHRWPPDTAFTRKVLIAEERVCPSCGGGRTICDHRRHPIYTLDGPLELICKLLHCPDKSCPAHSRTISPTAELAIVPPGWLIGWDVFCYIGHRRCSRHWSVPHLRSELADSYGIRLSADAIEVYIDRYQTMLAARHQDPQLLAAAYEKIDTLILSIDGLQPEKGHETVYTVRELNGKRVWFAVPLLSSSEDEVRQLFKQARAWAERLGKSVQLWMSDKQDAFVKGVAAEFPGIPHRYCANHFVRDVAKPMLENDSHAKVKMRKKVRGLRDIERQVLDDRREAADAAQEAEAVILVSVSVSDGAAQESEEGCGQVADLGSAEGVGVAEDATAGEGAAAAGVATAVAECTRLATVEDAGEVVLDYCVAVRGILNDDQGGPEHPTGLRMAGALTEVRESLQRNLDLEDKKGGERISN